MSTTPPCSPHSEPSELPDLDMREADFQDFVELAGDVFATAAVGVAACQEGGHRWLAQRGMEELPAVARAVFLRPGASRDPWLVADALAEPALSGLACSPGMPRFYASLGLLDAAGLPAGMLCIAATQPRSGCEDADAAALRRLGRMATRLLERHQLQRRNRIAAQILQADFSAMLVTDTQGHITFVNRAAQLLFGRGARAMRGMPVDILFPPALQADAAAAIAWLHPDGDASRRGQMHLRITDPTAAGNDRVRTLEAARCVWHLREGQGTALILRDITEQLDQERRLRHMALNDDLTGLPNRNALTETLKGMLAAAERRIGVALVDLDSFKTINDTLGHALGDEVLREAARRLSRSVPAGAFAARFGGDEFAVVYPDRSADDIGTALMALIAEVERPFEVDGHTVHLDTSIGLAMREPGLPDGDLVAQADLALYKAKRSGGRQMALFDPAMRKELVERRQLDLELRRAAARGEFELHYQPQVDLVNGRTVGAEALLRWRHPERGLLSPAVFIDALAASPIAAEVGAWILRQACQDAARWPQVDGRDVAISINLFPVQVNEGRLPADVDLALASSGLAANRLELEITETIALHPDGSAASTLASLRDRGIRLAFDDFGTGFASLSMLQRFPIDRVKIDRSFVRDMLANHSDAQIVRSIVLISRNLDLRVVAEGVESQDQAHLLRGLGCHGAQGFLYAPALDVAAFDRWLSSHFHDASILPPLAGLATAHA